MPVQEKLVPDRPWDFCRDAARGDQRLRKFADGRAQVGRLSPGTDAPVRHLGKKAVTLWRIILSDRHRQWLQAFRASLRNGFASLDPAPTREDSAPVRKQGGDQDEPVGLETSSNALTS